MNFKLLPVIVCTLLATMAIPLHAETQRLRERIDDRWKFYLGDVKDGESPGLDDAGWRTVALPHDWSIEGRIDKKNPTGGVGGFAPAGVGWYRHVIKAPEAWRGQTITLEFEGVYRGSQVWLNGEKVGGHPYGYSSFFVDLTGKLKTGADNILAVRVDNSTQKNSRWYSGSGIYRHVWLNVCDPVHIAPWGVFVKTLKATAESATLSVQIRMMNESSTTKLVAVETSLLAPDGSEAAKVSAGTFPIPSGKSETFSPEFAVKNPALWSPENPRMSALRTRLLVDGRLVDEVTTPFGIRELAWSSEKGLAINGKSQKLAGGCIHHDNSLLGSAAFDRAETRRIELLKAAGFNAIRTAHNIPSPALLDACDRLGMMVLDENFDCWESGKNPFDYHLHFKDWWQNDLDTMILRDRNHPSVVMWSIGNEIPNQFSERVAELSKLLAERIRSLDPTRPITEAVCEFSPKTEKGQSQDVQDRSMSALDIMGYNYGLGRLEKDHESIPSRIMVNTETFPKTAFQVWDLTNRNPYVLGDFVWTAIDYLGENGIGRWQYDREAKGMGVDDFFPWHSASCGDIDLIGSRKPVSHYRNIIWNHGEKLYIAVQRPAPDGRKIFFNYWGVYPAENSWTWPGFEKKPVKVDVYSRCDSVRLYQDGKLIGEKPTTEKQEFKASFDLVYSPGELKAVGLVNGKPVCEQVLATAGVPAGLRLIPDRTTLRADGQDLSFVTVEVTDKDGKYYPPGDHDIRFEIQGPGTIAGVGNADAQSLEAYQANHRKAFQGRALVVVRTSHEPGPIILKASADGLGEAKVRLEAQPE